jgi:hypothetical protein
MAVTHPIPHVTAIVTGTSPPASLPVIGRPVIMQHGIR